jgi:hypothetical protein
MEIYGKNTKLLPLQTGQGKNGTWKKQEYLLDTATNTPRQWSSIFGATRSTNTP